MFMKQIYVILVKLKFGNMRIAVLLRDKCQPKKCSSECVKFCPKVRTGDETIILGKKGKPTISEQLCVGCGICVHKCPFDAIRIIGLAEELEENLVHQFGENDFRLFGLPIPNKGQVIGILGKNGIGKSTAIQILAGEKIPNFGEYDTVPEWEDALEFYAGKELQEYFKLVENGELKAALKPQYVDKLGEQFKGNTAKLLRKVDQTGKFDEIINYLDLDMCLDRNITELSGGELQRVAIAATILKDADIYFFDEPSSYLDIYQRVNIAKLIQKLADDKQVMVVEHDLAVLDFLADNVHLLYGSEGVFGVVAQPRTVRHAINTYLSGYLREENIRFRDREIKFEIKPPRIEWESFSLLDFHKLYKKFKSFDLKTGKGTIHHGEVVGVVGPNAIGKTTFVKMLAGVIKPTKGIVDSVSVSYKPQYLETDFEDTVKNLFYSQPDKIFDNPIFKSEIERPLNIKPLENKLVTHLSGGEIQRVAIALALAREADIYLFDEPSAYLDSNQRMEAAKTIRRVMEKIGKSALIVDHDTYFIDLVSDTIMVFSGTPSVTGIGEGPFDLRTGMNKFLKDLEITFRRDNENNRPRINKMDSRLDREQKEKGEYYYLG